VVGGGMVVKVVDGFENFLGVLVVRRGGTVGDVWVVGALGLVCVLCERNWGEVCLWLCCLATVAVVCLSCAGSGLLLLHARMVFVFAVGLQAGVHALCLCVLVAAQACLLLQWWCFCVHAFCAVCCKRAAWLWCVGL
jgi:hypothetical protein